MATIIDQFTDRAARLLLRGGTVAAVEDLDAAFRRLTIQSPGASWSAGCKVQFRVAGTNFRTYTPFAWADDQVSFLLYRHDGGGPATDWMDALAPGDAVQMFGPRRSLVLDDLGEAPVIVGDETSFAVTAAWEEHGIAPAAARLYEVGDPASSASVLRHLRVPDADLVVRTPDDSHLPELCAGVLDALDAHPDAPLVLTGRAQTIRAVRGAVKDVGRSPTTRVKAYWDPNRSGLD